PSRSRRRPRSFLHNQLILVERNMSEPQELAKGVQVTPDGVTGWPRGITSFERRYGNAVTRLISGAIGIPIVLGAVWMGGWLFFALVAIAGAGALAEYFWLTEARGCVPI